MTKSAQVQSKQEADKLMEAERGIANKMIQSVRDRIIHVLTIYPILSPSMLQVGLGTSTQPGLWRPVLERMIDEGVVIVEEVQLEHPSGRSYPYKKLSLQPLSITKAAA